MVLYGIHHLLLKMLWPVMVLSQKGLRISRYSEWKEDTARLGGT